MWHSISVFADGWTYSLHGFMSVNSNMVLLLYIHEFIFSLLLAQLMLQMWQGKQMKKEKKKVEINSWDGTFTYLYHCVIEIRYV